TGRGTADGRTGGPAPPHRGNLVGRGIPAAGDHAGQPGRCDEGRRPCPARLRSAHQAGDGPAAHFARPHRPDPHHGRKAGLPPATGECRMTRPRGFMFDLDGTLILSDRKLGGYTAIPGAAEALEALDERGIPWIAMTNGSAYPASVQAPRLRAVGLDRKSTRL